MSGGRGVGSGAACRARDRKRRNWGLGFYIEDWHVWLVCEAFPVKILLNSGWHRRWRGWSNQALHSILLFRGDLLLCSSSLCLAWRMSLYLVRPIISPVACRITRVCRSTTFGLLQTIVPLLWPIRLKYFGGIETTMGKDYSPPW